jgi:hypothetical protein
VKDFMSLIRNVIITKLASEKDFTTRQFLSSDGSKIYLVLYSNINKMLEEVNFFYIYNKLIICVIIYIIL